MGKQLWAISFAGIYYYLLKIVDSVREESVRQTAQESFHWGTVIHLFRNIVGADTIKINHAG